MNEEKDIKETIREKVDVSVKEEVIDIYEDLLKTIWSKITPTLGLVTTAAMTDRAIKKTSNTYPIIRHLEIKEEQISFAELRTSMGERDRENIKDGFKDLIANLFDILAKLTGNILVDKLLKEVGDI